MGNEYYIISEDGELYHYGVKGMKWGVRRYQNKDGSLTALGKKRHQSDDDSFGLESDGLTLNDRLRFYESKLSSARARVRKDFNNDTDVKKHRDWIDEANRAYEKWYENEDSSKSEVLRAEMERLNYDHPEAKKHERLRDSYIYDNASNRLKNAIDEAKSNDWILDWTLQKHHSDYEYGALYDAYNYEYSQLIFADRLNHNSDGSDGELCHYGVKGMKWGVRRDARLLANARRNKRVRRAQDAYRSGKITKDERDKEFESAQRDKKKMLEKIKREFENTSSERTRARISNDIVNKTTAEVPNVTLKRGLASINTIFGGANIASMGVTSAALVAANPAFAGAAIAAGAIGTAAELGYRYVIQLGLDKAT